MVRAAEPDRADVKEKRRAWSERMPGLDPARLVFVDETGANTKMTRRAPRGRWRRPRSSPRGGPMG